MTVIFTLGTRHVTASHHSIVDGKQLLNIAAKYFPGRHVECRKFVSASLGGFLFEKVNRWAAASLARKKKQKKKTIII